MPPLSPSFVSSCLEGHDDLIALHERKGWEGGSGDAARRLLGNTEEDGRGWRDQPVTRGDSDCTMQEKDLAGTSAILIWCWWREAESSVIRNSAELWMDCLPPISTFQLANSQRTRIWVWFLQRISKDNVLRNDFGNVRYTIEGRREYQREGICSVRQCYEPASLCKPPPPLFNPELRQLWEWTGSALRVDKEGRREVSSSLSLPPFGRMNGNGRWIARLDQRRKGWIHKREAGRE